MLDNASAAQGLWGHEMTLQICYCRNCDEPFHQEHNADPWHEYCIKCRYVPFGTGGARNAHGVDIWGTMIMPDFEAANA